MIMIMNVIVDYVSYFGWRNDYDGIPSSRYRTMDLIRL